MNHVSLPIPIYVNVANAMLGMTTPGVTRGLWHGVHSRLSQVVLCHVMLETGAYWSGLPLHALSATAQFTDAATACRWGAMGERISATNMPFLAGQQTTVGTAVGRHTGILLDWLDGWATVPAEHKPLNLIALDAGPYVLAANNECRFHDEHLTDATLWDQPKQYRRIRDTFWR